MMAGLGFGDRASLALTKMIAGFLYEFPGLDLFTYAMVPCVLLSSTLAACLIPSLHAARINPIDALRSG